MMAQLRCQQVLLSTYPAQTLQCYLQVFDLGAGQRGFQTHEISNNVRA